MNLLKSITISSFIVISFAVLFLIIYLLIKKFKSKINSDGKLKISYGVWYAAIFLAGSNVISSTTNVAFEALDNLIKIQPAKITLEILKAMSLIIGIGFIWLLLWFFVVKFLTKLIPFKNDENEEMEDDNFGYFIIKGVLLIGIIFSLSSVLILILRSLIPNIEIPFYH